MIRRLIPLVLLLGVCITHASSISAAGTLAQCQSGNSLHSSVEPTDYKRKAIKLLDDLHLKLLLTDVKSPVGTEFFHQYFAYIRSALAFFYFNVNNKDDEKLWNRLLAEMYMKKL